MTIAERLSDSCTIDPVASLQTPSAIAAAALAAAGTVVTEMRTPTRAPDLVVVGDGMPRIIEALFADPGSRLGSL